MLKRLAVSVHLFKRQTTRPTPPRAFQPVVGKLCHASGSSVIMTQTLRNPKSLTLSSRPPLHLPPAFPLPESDHDLTLWRLFLGVSVLSPRRSKLLPIFPLNPAFSTRRSVPKCPNAVNIRHNEPVEHAFRRYPSYTG